MNKFATLFFSALAILACSGIARALTTPPNVGPVVTNPIPNYDQYLETTRAINLSAFFADPDAPAAAKLTTPLGSLTITLDGQHAPATVANFLNYVNSGRYFTIDPTNGERASTFFHRSVPNFVIQGGGYLGTVNPNGSGSVLVTQVATFPPVQNEAFISNIRGTIAMAKLGGDPNSATSQWFINLADNSANLDNQNGGFTAFGHVTGNGMGVADAIAAVPRFNLNSTFSELPLRNYTSPDPVRVPNLISISEFTPASPLAYTASSNNPNVATVTASGGNLLVTALQLGSAQITVTGFDLDGAGPVSQSFTVNVITAPGRIRNISTRANFPTGQETLTAGFIVRGGTSKRLVARARGTSSGVNGALDDPTLELLGPDNSVLATNDDWGTALNKQELIDVEIQPGADKESAILMTVPSTDAVPTTYTARMRSKNGHSGVGLVEIFDLDSQPGSTLRNVSTVGPVGTGVNVLVGGFIVRGSDARRVIVRGKGPSLTDLGINDALPDPTIELRNNQNMVVDFNDDWQMNPSAGEIEQIGLQPGHPKESAVIATLPAGEFTATVAGTGPTPTGIGQVEVFQVR